jgi:hypothetical protein
MCDIEVLAINDMRRTNLNMSVEKFFYSPTDV